VTDRPSEFRTTHTRFAAFLQMRKPNGVLFLGTEMGHNRGEVIWRFDDPERAIPGLLEGYPKSPEHQYDEACQSAFGVVRGMTGGRR